MNTQLNETPLCNIAKGTSTTKLLKNASAIIIDVTMAHNTVYQTINGTLQDILNNTLIFSGIPVLLCGGFRRLLPIVKCGIKRLYLWRNIKVRHLAINMRVFLAGEDAAEEANFSEILLQLGEGRLPIVGEEHTVNFPPHLGQIVCNIEELKNTVFPNLVQRYTDTDTDLREQFCPQSMKI